MQCNVEALILGNLDSFVLGIRFYVFYGSLWVRNSFLCKFNPIYRCLKDFFNKIKIIWSIVQFGTLPLWRCVGSSWWPETCQRIFGEQTISLFSVTGSHWILTVQCLVSTDSVSWCTGLAVQPPCTRNCRARVELVNRPVNKLLILMEELWRPYCRLVDFKSYVEF